MRAWLKKLRVKNGLTQQQMAKKLHISVQMYNFIELYTKQKDLDLSKACALSKIFRISLDDIVKKELALQKEKAKKEKKGE